MHSGWTPDEDENSGGSAYDRETSTQAHTGKRNALLRSFVVNIHNTSKRKTVTPKVPSVGDLGECVYLPSDFSSNELHQRHHALVRVVVATDDPHHTDGIHHGR